MKRAAETGTEGGNRLRKRAVGKDAGAKAIMAAAVVTTKRPGFVIMQKKLRLGLRALLGYNAGWKSYEQEQGAHRVFALRGREALIIVLPISGGKSLFFMLSALPAMNAKVSIVVVPFVALINDLAERAKRLGIDCL